MVESWFCHHASFENEYEHHCTEYEYDLPDQRSGSPSRRDDLSTVKNAPFGDFGASVCSAWGSVVVCSIPARLEPPGFCPTKPLSIIAPREAQLKPSVKRIRACLHAQMKHVFKRNRAFRHAQSSIVTRNGAQRQAQLGLNAERCR
jgi:hypothetical protein